MKARFWGLMLVCLAMLFVGVSCAGGGDDDKDKNLSWIEVARLFDRQLGRIADFVDPTCDGTTPVTVGTHCKNSLDGKVTTKDVAQYIHTVYDGTWVGMLSYEWRTVGPDFCGYDGDINSIPDVQEVCSTGGVWPSAGTLTCEQNGDDAVLTYTGCMWFNGVDSRWYKLDGKVWGKHRDLILTREHVSLLRYDNLAAQGLDPLDPANPLSEYLLNGVETIYEKIDPVFGTNVPGSTGANDGMRVIDITFTVDPDGAGLGIEGKYTTRAFLDYEDGIGFHNRDWEIVWVDNANTVFGPDSIELNFYDRNFPWNDGLAGCKVLADNIDPLTRTFDIVSAGAYGANGCLPDQVGVDY